MENLKLLNYQDAKELIKIFCNPVDEGKKFWVNSLIHSINFEYETLTPEMINEYNDLITLFKNLLPEMEINKETRDKFENVLNNCKKKEIKNEINTIKESTYTTKQAKAIKKYRQSEKGKEKNNELSKKYYEERKDIPEIKEKVKQAHKTSYSKLKEDPERYKLYLERKKELYHLRKEQHNELVEISLDEMIEDQNIINPVIN
jgi:hypothetical protein